jgi:hypothetical protein
MFQLRVVLNRHDAYSRTLFDALPMRLMGRSYCADYVLVEDGRSSDVCSRYRCEQHLTGQRDAFDSTVDGVSFCGSTPAIEALGQVFAGEHALDALLQHVAQIPVDLL